MKITPYAWDQSLRSDWLVSLTDTQKRTLWQLRHIIRDGPHLHWNAQAHAMIFWRNHHFLAALHQGGWRVRIRHFRQYEPVAVSQPHSPRPVPIVAYSQRDLAHALGNSQRPGYINILHHFCLNPRGGLTHFYIRPEDSPTRTYSDMLFVARCRADEPYNRYSGVHLCLTRFFNWIITGKTIL